MSHGTTTRVSELDLHQMVDWLRDALSGGQTLPRLTPDEPEHLAVARLEKTLPPRAGEMLREAASILVRDFCANPVADKPYSWEVLGMVAEFRNPENILRLAQLADRRDLFAKLPLPLRGGVLARLIGTPPHQSVDFWKRRLEEEPVEYAKLVFAGLLYGNPREALDVLPTLPDLERTGEAITFTLDLFWDGLQPEHKADFSSQLRRQLACCGPSLAGPIRQWLAGTGYLSLPTYSPLRHALEVALGDDAAPRRTHPGLVAA